MLQGVLAWTTFVAARREIEIAAAEVPYAIAGLCAFLTTPRGLVAANMAIG
jgi:hypothetical protein